MRSLIVFLFVVFGFLAVSQTSDSILMQHDAIYNRPFNSFGNSGIAIGGYLEGNTNYFSEDGISEGLSMEMRRFNIFLSSKIGERFRFISELEFEHGTKEIALETALVDLEIAEYLNIRMGVLLPELGCVNANHDSPVWDFIERPLSSVSLIPSTLSEIGFGIHGKFALKKSLVSYNLYLINGLQDGVILNSEGKTHLLSGKTSEMFEEDNNGIPMFNSRIAISNYKFGELGIAYYGGYYNTFMLEGEILAPKRALNVYAIDLDTDIGKLNIKAELVQIALDVPEDIEEIYGEAQFGGFLDLVYPVYNDKLFTYESSVLNILFRIEFADYNQGNFKTNIYTKKIDETYGLVTGMSWRPNENAVLKLNYSYHLVYDLIGNPPAKIGGVQFGFASYF